MIIVSFPASLALGYGSIAKPAITSTPLRLFKEGVSIEDIVCNEGLHLIIKAEDGSPACVKIETGKELVKRGWASSIIVTPPTVQQTSGNNTLPDSFEPCDTPFTQSNNGIAVLYMPVNSIGKICVRYFNPNESKNASLTIFDASSYQTTKSITSWAEPSMIPTGNSTVRFSVKTGNQTGFYGLTIFCSGMPFAVGYDAKSNFTLNDFPWEKSPTMSCPMMTYQYKIDSLSGIGVRYVPYP